MKYEPTQKGNPHRLTVNQHVFPKRSIDRFSGANGTVHVFIKSANKTVRVRADHSLFCARRAWDQRAEALVMKSIEDRFQPIADAILRDGHAAWLHFSHHALSQFFALWTERFYAFASPSPDAKLNGIVGMERTLSKDEQEVLESKFMVFANNDLTISGRFLTGLKIQIATMRRAASLASVRWGIWKAKPDAGSFLVPDDFAGHMVIPISPEICLVGNDGNRYVGRPEIAEINRIAFTTSQNHFFGADLSRCPLIP